MSKRERLAAKAFEAFAVDYDERIGRGMARDTGVEYGDFILKFIKLCDSPQECNVLDLATGTASVALALARREDGGCRIAAVDITQGMLRQAKRKVEEAGLGKYIYVCNGSGNGLPFVDGSFSLVTCSLAFHHMHVADVLEELKRVLTSHGRLVMADMGAPPAWRKPWGRVIAPFYLMVRRLRDRRPIRSGSKMYTLHEWKNLLSQAGFSTTQEKCFFKGNWRPRLILLSAVLSGDD